MLMSEAKETPDCSSGPMRCSAADGPQLPMTPAGSADDSAPKCKHGWQFVLPELAGANRVCMLCDTILPRVQDDL